jgi:polar amino acid transport system substrate-binding protein
MWREGDKIVGTGPDVLSSLLAAQGVSLDSLYMGNWKRCLAELKNGSIDFVVAAYRTEQRADFLDYARVPLSPDPVAVFVWQGRAFRFERWEDLIGREMGSMLGISHGESFDLFAQQLSNQQVNEVSQIFKQLELGRIDFFPGGLHPWLTRIRAYGYEERISPLNRPVHEQDLYFGVGKESRCRRYLPGIETDLEAMQAADEVEPLIQFYTERYIDQRRGGIKPSSAE